MSNIGRGALGLQDSLLDFEFFAGLSNTAKRVDVDLQGGLVVTVWAQFGETQSYYSELGQSFDGMEPLIPAGVFLSDGNLSEVETVETCFATENTWFYDRANDRIYLHLEGGADPGDFTVVVTFAFPFATRGRVEPMVGPPKVTDGGFEDWNTDDPPALTSWTQNNVGARPPTTSEGVYIDRIDTGQKEGKYHVRILPSETDGLQATEGGGVTSAAMEAVEGQHYIALGYYRTVGLVRNGDLEARIRPRVNDGSDHYMDQYGREETASDDGLTLNPTNSEWRQFIYAMRAPVDGDLYITVALFNTGGSNFIGDGTQYVEFDNVQMWRVREYRYREPRLAAGGIPELQRAANDVFFGSETAGLGNLVLLNRDDSRGLASDPFLETMLGGDLDFCSQRAFLKYGGVLPNQQEIPYVAEEPGWAGALRRFDVDALGASLQLESARAILSTELPIAVWDRDAYAELAEADLNRPIPIVYGTVTNARPGRLGITGDLLGIYGALDPAYAPDPSDIAEDPSAIYAYVDEDAAGRKDVDKRVLLVDGSDYDLTADVYNVTGQFRMIANPGPIVIEAAVNDSLDFNIGAGEVTATLTPGVYSWRTLLIEVDTQLTAAAAGPSFTITYNFPAQDITLTVGSGAVTLMVETGSHADRSAWPLLGFTQDEASVTGGTTYTGATPVEHNPDTQVIRMDMTGYKDDASGTYTGTPGALIELASDVVVAGLRLILNVPATDIDQVSFTDGRTTSPQLLGVYLGTLASVGGGGGSTLTLQEHHDRLEVGAYAEFQVDALGRWSMVPRIDDVPGYAASVAVVLSNADFLDFSASRSTDDVYHTVRLNFAQDPSTGVVQSRTITNQHTPTRFDRRQSIEFNSYLLDPDDVAEIVAKLARPAVRPVNTYRVVVKGKLMRMKIGQVLDVSARIRKLAEPSDQSEPYLCRLQELKWNPLTHVCEATAYTQYFGLPPS